MKMIELVERFPAQLTESLEIGRKATIRQHTSPIRNVYVSGLGGSGIGANFVAEFTRDALKVPFQVGKGYTIPASINKFTLVIVSSYSGNTEETLASFEALLKTGAKIVCIASGGKVIAKAKELDLDFIQVPANWPSPRACLGFSLVQQLFVLNYLKLISGQVIKQIEGSIQLLEKEKESIKKQAQSLAGQLLGKIPVIYTTDRMESVAVRFRQQVNENAKCLAWHHVVPEMNHNELVGWREKNNQLAVVYFRNEDDFQRNAVRIDINKSIISEYTSTVIELWSKGKNLVEKSMYFVFLGDYITCYLCDLRGFDSIEVKVIDYLKNELAKV
ncbi:MAG: bifunctional phosphoglucose/phosphomannose isomerase [Bacteroidota bacterium]|jgi:glucose/mannose-6-phosphate isomerase